MRYKHVTKRMLMVCLVIILCLSFLPSFSGVNQTIYADEEGEITETNQLADFEFELEPYYYEKKQEWDKEGIKPGTSKLEIDAKDYRTKADVGIEVGNYGTEQDVLLFTDPSGWAEYEITVDESGLYEIGLSYLPFFEEDGGSRQSVVIGAQINGEFPFREARSFEFRRNYRDQEAQYDDEDNQIRSLVEDITDWDKQMLRDSGVSVAPFVFHLDKGKNTIKLQALRESVAIKDITIQPPTTYPTYEEVKAPYPEESSEARELITIEAEDFSNKNSTSIQVQYDRSPLTTPESLKKIKFNTLGGMSWYKGGQKVSWEFEVPESGEYKLAFRGLQNFQDNLSIFRTIYIDGEIPFEELKHYQIPYSSGWQEIVLEDESSDPYTFFFEKGTHTITFEATHEPFDPLVVEIDNLSREIRDITLELQVASGSQEDAFRVWNVKEELPGLIESMEAMQQKLEDMATKMIEINGGTTNISQSFESIAKELASLLEEPNEIPNNQVRIGALQEQLETQRQELLSSPLQIDKFYLAPPSEDFPRMTANWFEKIKGTFNTLVYSFSERNNLREQTDEELNVWMMWGRDYAEELQQLADQQYTPEHGVKVNVNLIQDPNLLIMAKAAGIMPDVALGVPSTMPFEMALRGAAKDLSELPNSEQLLNNYAPGTLLPYYYNEGYYGIPETINFKVLFYRKDILSHLGLEIPNTWEDVYDMVPTLLQNQYNFYADPLDFSYMLYQNDVELYREDGLATALDQAKAFRAFEEWTDLFNLHGMDTKVQSFYQQFRKGTMPIGIADFNDYMQLLVAAPEITDVWGLAPIPGHVNEDGEIVRWAGGTGLDTTSMMLFNDTPPEKQELAWEFLQWYASTETQTQYGLNLEQYRDETFRWNSANIEAFVEMPWREADLEAIIQQWKWIKDLPNVPGSYMTTRQLEFAWNQTVIESQNPRIELEKAIKEINREMKRKQAEFNIIDEDGNVIDPIGHIQVKEPWEGVTPFE